jgi:hypothetical protein
MSHQDQQVLDRGVHRAGASGRPATGLGQAPEGAQRAARRSLQAQIARLEGELSDIVAERFPFIQAPAPEPQAAGPRLLDLGALERTRDRLAAQVQDVRAAAAARIEHERRSREQLERMKLEPGRYRFVRLPVSDLGQGGCGVWQVRPRLGIIGMLAGWWELTLSSGCPLPRGRAPRATRLGAPEHLGERPSLAVCHGADRLLLGHRYLCEELAAACLAPSALAHQQVRDGHALRLPRAVAYHLGDARPARGDAPLELGAGETDLVGALQRAHVLRTGRGYRRCRVHRTSILLTRGSRRRALFEFCRGASAMAE